MNTSNDWLEVIKNADKPEIVPEGWQTARQISQMMNIAESSVWRKLRKALDSGIVIKKNFRINVESKGVYPIPHYFIKK